MSAPTPSQSPDKKPVRKRSPLERALVWGGLLCLLLIFLLEQTSRTNFEASLKTLKSAIQAGSPDGKQQGISPADASRYIQGFALRRDETSNGRPKITYRWPSLFKTYQISMISESDDRISRVDSGSIPDGQEPRLKVARVESLKRPERGLSKQATDIFALQSDSSPMPPENLGQGTLTRELVRQAFLIAAREELGLHTQDASLGEIADVTTSIDAFPFETQIELGSNSSKDANISIRVKILRPTLIGKPFEWTSPEFRFTEFNCHDVLAEQLEVCSRGDFVKVLRDAGFQKSEKRAGASAQPDKLSENVANRFDLVSQFAVLRSLHADIAAHGETSEKIKGLARAYANLGSLTDYHWSLASKAFKARSLLYAQRLIGKYAQSADALAQRAYVRALCGRHATALNDVAAAQAAKVGEVPGWLNLIEAYCQFQREPLQDVKGPNAELALYLAMGLTDIEHDEPDAVETVLKFSTANSACCRSPELLSQMSDGAKGHVAGRGFDVLWPEIYQRLAGIPSLPSHAKEVADQILDKTVPTSPNEEHLARIALIRHLRQAGDDTRDLSELSWSVLSELLREDSFIQVWRSIDYEDLMMGQTSPYQWTLMPLVEGHRFEPLIKCYGARPDSTVKSLLEFVKTIDAKYQEPPTWPIYRFFHRKLDARTGNDRNSLNGFRDVVMSHLDATNDDLILRSGIMFLMPNRGAVAEKLRKVSPSNPASIAATIETDWPFAKSHAVEWEKTFGNSPQVLHALAYAYQLHHENDDMLRCLEKSVAIAPSFKAHEFLAREYRRRGNNKGYQETLEKALKLPSLGMETDNIRMDLARMYIQNRDFEKAQAHAEIAVRTGAAWASQMAAQCAEGLQQWDAAEKYHQDVARYEESSANWYFWCTRVGRGNIDAARAHARRYWKTLAPPLTPDQKLLRGLGYLIENDRAKALDMFEDLLPQSGECFVALMAGLTADQLGDTTRRDLHFKNAPKRRNATLQVTNLMDLFATALRRPGECHWNSDAFEGLMVHAMTHQVTLLYYCAGTFLETHGQQELAREYLECAATSFDFQTHECLLANHALRSRQIEVGPTRSDELADHLVEPAKLLKVAQNEWELRLVLNASKGCEMALRRCPILQTKVMEQLKGRLEPDGILKVIKVELSKINPAESDSALAQVRKLLPNLTAALVMRGQLNEERGRFRDAISDYEEAIWINPENGVAHDQLALTLASCSQDDIRNGTRALEHANRAIDLRETKKWNNFHTLAAAYAECGKFDKAVEAEQEATKLNKFSLEAVHALRLYQEKKPYHRLPVSVGLAP